MNKTKIEWVKNPDGSQGYTWNPDYHGAYIIPRPIIKHLINSLLQGKMP